MATTRVQRILDEVGSIAFAGVYDTLSAKLARQAGFPLAFISGYSVAATAIGEPDMGLLTQTEMIEQARRVCGSVDIPIIVDADTGYGNPLNVFRTVKELIAAGAAGCFLEDQVWPKKCGHMRGKRVVERDEYVQNIRAASEARGTADFFIVARTDALAPVGIDEAIARVDRRTRGGGRRQFRRGPALAGTAGRDRPPCAETDGGQHARRGQDAGVAQGAVGRDGFSTDSLSLDGAVRGGPRDREFLQKTPRRRHHPRRGTSADDVRRVQRVDRGGGKIRPGRAIWSAINRSIAMHALLLTAVMVFLGSDQQTVLGYVGNTSADKRSLADSGFAVEFERPTDQKSIVAVKIFAVRYGYPKPPKDDFHIYLLDQDQKVLEQIAVPYAKIERGDLRWYTLDFPAIDLPEQFFVALWFNAEQTKGIYLGMEKSIRPTHSFIGLPNKGYQKADPPCEWMIQAVMSSENGKKPTFPEVKPTGRRKRPMRRVRKAPPVRTWKDASGAFSVKHNWSIARMTKSC